jgi:hypothetical protein
MGAKPTAVVHPNKTKLFEAVRAEWIVRYAILLGHPWDAPKVKEWLEELWALLKTDREAIRAMSLLRKGIGAIETFCKKNAPIGKQERHGLKFHLDFAPDHTDISLYIDPETMPANIDGWEELPNPLHRRTVKGMYVPVEMEAKVESCSYPTAVISCSGRLDGMTPFGMAVHMLRPTLKDVTEVLAKLLRNRTRASAWEARLAVLVIWDREYLPGELPENRKRLSASELAGISILTGNRPKLGEKALTVSNAIDAEARHIVRAREQLEKLRVAGVPIPRHMHAPDIGVGGGPVQGGTANGESVAI